MPATYEPIATTTLSSGTLSINFSGISSAYTDLRLVFTFLGATSARMQVNSNTGTNYSSTFLYGLNGTTASSGNRVNDDHIPITLTAATSTIPVMTIVDFSNYGGSTFKTFLWQESGDKNGSTSWVIKGAGLWRSTSSITSIQLYAPSVNFDAGSTATLYGILKA